MYAGGGHDNWCGRQRGGRAPGRRSGDRVRNRGHIHFRRTGAENLGRPAHRAGRPSRCSFSIGRCAVRAFALGHSGANKDRQHCPARQGPERRAVRHRGRTARYGGHGGGRGGHRTGRAKADPFHNRFRGHGGSGGHGPETGHGHGQLRRRRSAKRGILPRAPASAGYRFMAAVSTTSSAWCT